MSRFTQEDVEFLSLIARDIPRGTDDEMDLLISRIQEDITEIPSLSILIHDLPISLPAIGLSFHASDYPVKTLWWSGEGLTVVDASRREWVFDFDGFKWDG